MDALYIAAKKLLSDGSVNHYMEHLAAFPEGQWFAPSNQQGDHFSVCQTMADFGLIAMRKKPIWQNGSFKGLRIEFLYLNSLNYGETIGGTD